MKTTYSYELEIALKAINRASEKTKELFRRGLAVSQKPGFESQQVVSEADFASETILREILATSFPGYGILSEEMEIENIGAEKIWILDPLCGSLFYGRGLSQWSISIALLCNDDITLSIISNPFYGEIFWAQKNKGAYLNNEMIKVSRTASIEESIISVGHRDLRLDAYREKTEVLVKKTKRLITMDNHWALTQLAAGRIDAVIRAEQPSYEIAAGALLISEAGGAFTYFNGREISLERSKKRSINYLASNGLLHSALLAILE
ncbi:MAG: inositol monophosphatase [Thermodesulfobacteriota bacterium]